MKIIGAIIILGYLVRILQAIHLGIPARAYVPYLADWLSYCITAL
jgi:hypothetical protein